MFLRISITAHAALLLSIALFLLGHRILPLALVGSYLAYHAWLAWAVLHPRSRLFGPNLSRLDTNERVVALTFDDGPHPEITPRVLDLLRVRRIPATFFLIGRWVELYPELARRIVEEGHDVGSHSHGHSYLFWALPPGHLARDVGRAERALRAATGRSGRWFRAPVGMKSCFLQSVLARQGLALVSWSVRFLDRRGSDARSLRARLERRVSPGGILMMHDGHDRRPDGNPAVLENLPIVLEWLERMDYRCVKLG